ncbi:Rid family detoxifying hydrolase [Paenibacillus sp. GCM10027626]|uniref:Rid family detoxifying hydrolase n=1 Tax=Paenibacillus sp. GCM10027626 TaxID=3273411 RepID=UPI003645CB09
MEKQSLYTDKALHSGASYSQGIVSGDLVFVSGQVPVDPATKQIKGGSIREQTHAVLQSIRAILAEAGAGMDDIVKLNCYLTDLKHFTEMNEVFSSYFNEPYPARITVGVQLIGFDVEMDCIARISSGVKPVCIK